MAPPRQDYSNGKTCTGCDRNLPVSEFSIRADRQRPRSRCRACESEAARPRARHRTQTQREELRAYRLLRKFGITVEQYDEMFAAQGGVCAICSCPPHYKRLAVDHNHETGQVRGLLCGWCNRSLGGFRDSTELLVSAARYLKDFGPITVERRL